LDATTEVIYGFKMIYNMMRRVLLLMALLLMVFIAIPGHYPVGPGYSKAADPDEPPTGNHTIVMGPFLEYNYIKGENDYVQHLKIVALTPEGYEYAARTELDGIATFEEMPWPEFPNGTHFEAKGFTHDDTEWEKGEPQPLIETNYWEIGGTVVLVYAAPLLVLFLLILFAKLNKKKRE
jgi:hypothetical protein